MSDCDKNACNIPPFENKEDKDEYKKELLVNRMENYVSQLGEMVESIENNSKLLSVCSEEINNVASKISTRLEEEFRKKTRSQSEEIKETLKESIQESTKKLEELTCQSEDLLRKNRWAYNKKHWLLSGAFGLGVLSCSTFLSYLLLMQNLGKMDEKIVHLASLGSNLEIARNALNDKERAKLNEVLDQAWRNAQKKT